MEHCLGLELFTLFNCSGHHLPLQHQKHLHSIPRAQFTQDTEHLATPTRKLWNTLWSMGVFTQLASNIKGFAGKFACKCAYASCVNGPCKSPCVFHTFCVLNRAGRYSFVSVMARTVRLNQRKRRSGGKGEAVLNW